jgi:hypothetical protein
MISPPGSTAPLMKNDSIIEVSVPELLPERPLVSIYMATYNHGLYVAQAIEGVLRQRAEFPIELVIGEDGSDDDTRAIVLKYQQRHPEVIRIITGPRNIGAIANGNRCIPLCRGEFFAYCEGDDYWHHPDKLQLQVQALRQNPAAHLVHTDYDRLVGNRVLRNANARQRAVPAQGDQAIISLLYGMSVTTATSLYRKRIIDELRDSGLSSPDWPFGDYPKALYAAMRGPVIYLPISTATYRQVEGSAMNQGRLRSLRMQEAGLACREVFMQAAGVPEEIRRDVRAHAHRILRAHALLLGDRAGYAAEERWLAANGQSGRRPSHGVASVILSFPLLLRTYRTLLNTRGRIKRFLSFERMP